MSTVHVVAAALVLVGIGIRLWKYRDYMDAHFHRYGTVPPRNWLWTRVADPAVERLRRTMAVGSVIAIVGLLLLAFEFLAVPLRR